MDKEIIQKFLEYTVSNPLPKDMNQEQCGEGKDYWNSDYWTMEVSAYLFLGDDYIIPYGFKDNKNYGIERIKHDAEIKEAVYYNLQKIQFDCDCLLICEVGRGLDILMANMVRQWKKIYCYDQVNYSRYLKYFKGDIEFFHVTTNGFRMGIDEYIPENVIMVCNHSIYKPMEHKKIIHGIIDGVLKYGNQK